MTILLGGFLFATFKQVKKDKKIIWRNLKPDLLGAFLMPIFFMANYK